MLALLPTLSSPATTPLVVSGAEVLQATFEVAGVRGADLLPAGLAPTVPTLATFLVVRAPDSSLGPWSMAQLRLSCRSGVRARALAVTTLVDGPAEAAATLAAGWGLGGSEGSVVLDRRYDHVRASVPSWSLELELHDAQTISTADLQYVTGLHPVDWQGEERLVQVELDIEPARVERGRPRLLAYDGFGSHRVVPKHPVVATIAVATWTLPAVRFVLRPDQLPHLGTERL